MVYIYLPATYYHLNLDVTKENLLVAGFSAVPGVFLVNLKLLAVIIKAWKSHGKASIFFKKILTFNVEIIHDVITFEQV